MIEDWHNFEKEDIRTILDVERVTAMKKVALPDIDKELESFWSKEKSQTPKKLPLWRRWYVAASIAAVISFGMFFIFLSKNKSKNAIEGVQVYAACASAQDLKLDVSGRTYILNKDGNNVPSELGIDIKGRSIVFKKSQKANDLNGLRTLTTPCGGIYSIVLPDGTSIHLNAASKLTFPTIFTSKERKVILKGEAYFEVAHDAKHPFIVQTDYFKTTVLGTKFNIRAYSRAEANVTLIEGKVRVENKNFAPVILQPEEEAILQSDGQLSKQKTDIYPYLEWQKGDFYFDDTPLIEVMKELGRWYNVDIIFHNKKMMYEKMHFAANRNENIQNAINNLNELGIVHIVYNGSKVYIK